MKVNFKKTASEFLFSAPFMIYKLVDSAALNQKLITESYEWKKQDLGQKNSNFGNSWHSPATLLTRDEPGFRQITQCIPMVAANYVKELNPKIKINEFNFNANAWININGTGGYNTTHHHGEFHISGVYYVKQPSKAQGRSGMIEFINSRFDNHIHEEIGTNAFAPKVNFRPKEGEMIVFPSTLLHSVYPNETNDDRISLAWNLKFLSKNRK